MAAASKLVNERVTFAKDGEVIENAKLFPNVASSTAAAAALNVLCPEMYSGKFGVAISGTHVAAAVV